MQNNPHKPLMDAIAAVLDGAATTTEILEALELGAPNSVVPPAHHNSAKAQIVLLTRAVRALKIELLSRDDADWKIADTILSLQRGYDKSGLDWFLSYYKESAFASLSPKRRMAIATWLVDKARQEQVVVPAYWITLTNQQGLLENE